MSLTDKIEQTRRELLELTARNRLVHTPLEGKRKSWIQIVDEQTDHVFQMLVRDGRTMEMRAAVDETSAQTTEGTPEPAAEETSEPTEERSESAEERTDGDDASEQTPGRVAEVSLDYRIASDSIVLETSDEEETAAETDAAVPLKHTDRFLQTMLPADQLNDRLLRCFYDARTAEEEQGVSILFLACGFLQWREAAGSTVNRFAPLLLIPVELTRNSVRSQFRLRFRDDEIVTNLSIQARLEQDFGIRLPDLPEDLQDDDSWSPSSYFAEVRKLVEHREGWEVRENEILLWFFSFTKFLMFRDLSTEAWPDHSGLEQHPLVGSLLDGGFQGGEMMPPICGDDEPIDHRLNPADVIHVTDADSSQAIAIEEITRGRNLVVQGPPGTGKSQTITNSIAAAVHAGKRVLFVAEKMAALDVVKRRLDAIGLGPMTLELHSHKARKRQVLEDLRATLELGKPTGIKEVPVDELREAAERLRRHDAVLHEPVGRSECTPYQAMGRLLRLRAGGDRVLPYQVEAAIEWTPEEFNERRRIATDLDRLLETSGAPANNPWRGVTCGPMTPGDLQRLFTRLRPIREQIDRLVHDAQSLSAALGLPPAERLLDVSRQAQIASHLVQYPQATDRAALADPRWETELDALLQTLDEIDRVQKHRATIGDRLSDAAWDLDWSQARVSLAAHGTSWFRWLFAGYRGAVATLRGVMRGPLPKVADQRVALIDAIIAVQQGSRRIESQDALGRGLLGRLWRGRDTAVEPARQVVQWVQRAAQNPATQQQTRGIAASGVDVDQLRDSLAAVAATLKDVDRGLSELADTLRLDLNAAFACDRTQAVPLAAWRECIDGWLASPEQLSHYLATQARIDGLRRAGVEPLADEVQRGEIATGEVADRLEWILCDAVLAEAWRTRPELSQFHGDAFAQLRSRFATLDTARIVLSRLLVARQHHAHLPDSMADGGQMGVLRREISKKRRHMPIRRLINEAGHAIQKIKPVFMMSPLSVAQFLEPGAVEFDLLVIDEASQVEPVDALGAIVRCKQIVVVGDQKQLPPTNFFGRLSGDDQEYDGEDSGPATDVESILGLCEAQGVPSRMLRWHYRSRHESLIAVSNRQFYDDRLFIVPSPIASGGSLGLKFRFVANGWYDRGGSRVNRPEAIAVADAVMEHARQRPEMSLGVATFSIAQRDAILDELDLRRKADTSLEDFFAAGGAEPFFVKSLENVQGDQRDVMFISIGYAKDKDGYFAQNFGPLNRKGGERRLNVLISRAAAACEVFTSLKSSDIDLSRTGSEGVVALKMYLEYAEHGRLEAAQSHGRADSVFEEQVAAALRGIGLEVDHQIGVAGFFVDLAIRDPERRGRYLLGIECDGAQYHSARWVRDRDRLREQVLASRGWRIHRIWSTDWFQRPDEQLDRVREALERARQHWNEVDRAESDAATIVMTRVTIPEAAPEPLWQRVEGEEDANELCGPAIHYVETSSSVRGVRGNPTELPPDVLAKLVQKIVDTEAPIHLHEIARRVISLLGRGRLTGTIKRAVGSAVALLEKRKRAERREDFVYQVDQTHFPPRHRRALDNAMLRKIEYIAPEELDAALLAVIAEHIGTTEWETLSATAKMLGIQNSPTFQTIAAQRLAGLRAGDHVVTRDGRYFAQLTIDTASDSR